jgi:Family of unknown function (DUF5709)
VSRTPETPSPYEAEGIPDPGTTTDPQAATGQAEGGYEPPHDTAVAVEDFGTTPSEMHDGEPLDGRLARETPDVIDLREDAVPDERAGQGVGRLVAPDEGARSDIDKEMVASDAGTDLGGYSAEEAAMHVVPEA